MVIKHIRKRLYQAIMLPLITLLSVPALPCFAFFALIVIIWEAENINKVLKYIIAAPLAVLCLLCAIPIIVLLLPVNTILMVAKIALFPEFFLSLWIKEGVKLSRVLSLSTTHFSNKDLHAADFESFLEIKNNNRELLVKFLKSDYLGIQEVIFCHEKHSKLLENVTTKILDKEKSKIIFDYLDLGNLKPLIQKNDHNNQYYPHEIYNTYWMLIRVVNDIDIGLLKTLLKLDGSSLVREPRYARASRLSNILDLFYDYFDYLNDHSLVKNMSDAFKNKKMLGVQVIKDFCPYLASEYGRDVRKNNLRRFFAKKDLIDNLSSGFNPQSSLIGVIKHFLLKKMREEEFDKFILMLEDKNVIKNLKLIDNINNILPGTLECNSCGIFLGLERIINHTVDDLHSLLANDRLFNKLENTPPKVLKDICNTALYTKCKSFDEALALFDCLDDESKNKKVFDNLKVAFEKDPQATNQLLNSKLFNSHDEILQMLSDERFDATKIKEMLKNTNLLSILMKNKLVDNVTSTEKIDCVLDIGEIEALFLAQSIIYRQSHQWDKQQSRIFFRDARLFAICLLYLKDSFIASTKFEHFVNSNFTENLRNNIHRYSAQLLNFDILEFLLNKIQDSGISNTLLNKIQSLHATPMELLENILETKFIEFFAEDKYQEIGDESLAKIQDLTIADLLAIPRRSAKIEDRLKDNGITNSKLAKLIYNSMCFVDTVK